MSSTSSPPTEKALSTLLTPEQYWDLFCSVNTLPELPEDSEPHIRVADRLSSTEERDRLLTRRTHRPSVQGIISIARQGHKRHKSSGSGENADPPGSHGGQLTFWPSGSPLIATSSHDFSSSDLQVKSLKVFPLHSQSQPARVSVASIQNATLSRPSFKKFKLQTEDHLDAFTARRCCGKLLVVGLADQGLGPLAAFQGLTLTVTDNKDGYLTISAGQKVDVDLADVNNQLQRQVLSAEFRTVFTVNEKVFLYHTLVWPPPATHATPADMGHDFSDMFQGLFEDLDLDLDLAEEESNSNQHPHFPAMSVGGPAPSNAGSSDQPVLNVQGDMTVSGVVRAQQFLSLSDEHAKCDIRKSDHDALSILKLLNIYQYHFKSNPEGRQILGLLAQEVQQVVPDFVETNLNCGSRVDSASLLSLTMQAVQQLCEQQQDIGSRLSFVLLKLGSLSKNSVLTLEASVSTPSRAQANSMQAPTTAALATAEPTTAGPVTAPPCSSTDAAEGSQALPDFKDNDAMVQHMLHALGETNTGLHQMVLNRIADFDHQSVWDSFQEALPQGSQGKRLFINSLKKKQQDLKMRSAARPLAPMSPLRPAQTRLLECLTSKQNMIIVAKTGFGKTRVAQEHIQRLLNEDKKARTIFLTDKTLLAMQQTSTLQSSVRVACFTSYSPITVAKWPAALKSNDVLVMTPESLVNMLNAGVVDFSNISLLVFDECHHAMANHPFNQVLTHWKEQHARGPARTQVLGLTGSPGGCADPIATLQKQWLLCKNMDAQLLCVPFDSAEVKEIAPPATEVILEVDLRAEDINFANQLAAVLLSHINVLANTLTGTEVPAEVSQALQSGISSQTLESWLMGLSTPAADAADCDIHVRLLMACHTCHDQVKVVGSERARQSLGSSCCDAMFGTASSCTDSACGSTQTPTSSHKPWSVAQLTTDLLAELAATIFQSPTVLKALQSCLPGTAVTFPKAQKLVQFLGQMKVDKSSWHGSVFVKTRAGVHALAEMLQHTAELQEVSVSTLTGHGKTGNVSGVTDAMKGMNIKRQVETLDSFRAAQGMNLLVATAAAEEGVDVPRCEFAVSYTVVETGREWTQRQGRARMHGSKFVSIVARGTTDLAQLEKSKREAENEYAAVMQSCFIV